MGQLFFNFILSKYIVYVKQNLRVDFCAVSQNKTNFPPETHLKQALSRKKTPLPFLTGEKNDFFFYA